VTDKPACQFRLSGVTRSVGTVRVLDQIDLRINATGITVIVGRSGSGKTSLLRLLNRLDAPTEGTVTWADADIAATDVCDLRRTVGYVAQRPVVFEGTALDNLRVPDPDISRDRAHELLVLVGLGEQAGQDAATLSGGEAQRLSVARTLVTEPDVILADEPTSSLDAEATTRIEALARRLVDAKQVAWIWVSHDLSQMKRLADSVVVMEQRRVIAKGTVDELVNHPDAAVRSAVGGR